MCGGNSLSFKTTLFNFFWILSFSFLRCCLVSDIEFFLRLFMYSYRIDLSDISSRLSRSGCLLSNRTSSDCCFSIFAGSCAAGIGPPLSMQSLLRSFSMDPLKRISPLIAGFVLRRISSPLPCGPWRYAPNPT